jgi:hypothetical protein
MRSEIKKDVRELREVPKTVVARCMYRLYRVPPATGSWRFTSSRSV